MIRYALIFLVNFLGTLPILGALLLVAAVNYNRDHRVKQSIVPLFAVLHIAVGLFFLYKFNKSIREFLVSISQQLPADIAQIISSNLYLTFLLIQHQQYHLR